MNHQYKQEQKTVPICSENAAREEELKNQLEKIVLLNNDYLHQIKKMEEELENLKRRLSSIFPMESQSVTHNGKSGTKSNSLSDQLKGIENKNYDLRDSYSFRIGRIFIDAVSKPGKNTIMMPFRMVAILFEIYFARKA